MNKSEFFKRLNKDIKALEKENSQKRFPITITVESKEYGKKVFHSDSLILTANNKKGVFALTQFQDARGLTLLKLGIKQIESIEETIKNEDFEPARHIFLSMLKDIIDQFSD